MSRQLKNCVEVMKLLGDETRVKILRTIKKHRELCVYEIAERIDMSHSATSHQLARLELGGVVESMRDGQRICYSLARTQQAKRAAKILKLYTLI